MAESFICNDSLVEADPKVKDSYKNGAGTVKKPAVKDTQKNPSNAESSIKGTDKKDP